MHVIVCGAGVAGLACAIALRRKGIQVTIYERAEGLSTFGASIAAHPTSVRILTEWDVYEQLIQKYGGCLIEGIKYKRYDTADVLFDVPPTLVQDQKREYSRALHDTAVAAGAEIVFSSVVIEIDTETPSITLANGEVVQADLIVAADGIRSRLRDKILPGPPVKVLQYGAGWSWFVSAERIAAHPETKFILDGPATYHFYYGPQSLCFVFPIESRKVYSIFLKAPKGDSENAKFGELISMDRVKQVLLPFHLACQRLADMNITDSAFVWPVAALDQPTQYHAESGMAVVIGDAAHSMVPHLGAGSSMALEDVFALGEFITQAQSKDDIPSLIRQWSNFRVPRATHVARIALEISRVQEADDGPIQERRDAQYKKATAILHKAAELNLKAPKIEGDPYAPLGSPESRAYVQDYNVKDECMKAISAMA